MAVFGQDDFTGTDGTLLSAHTPDVGGSWVKHGSHTGEIAIASNRAAHQGGNLKALYYINTAPGGSNTAEYDVEAGVVELSADDTPIVVGRVDTAADTWYGARYRTNGALNIIRCVTGTQTQLVTSAGHTAPFTLKIEIRDATKKLFKDGVEILSSTDNTITAAGRAGLYFEGATTNDTTGRVLDNFVATDLSVGGSSTFSNFYQRRFREFYA